VHTQKKNYLNYAVKVKLICMAALQVEHGR
jgi:hypothetical protein